ncbi:hypothetical protein PO124_04825 [Bacillus licheniformis]|nr:hypothetical protein [Bacillus licheniformis]
MHKLEDGYETELGRLFGGRNLSGENGSGSPYPAHLCVMSLPTFNI